MLFPKLSAQFKTGRHPYSRSGHEFPPHVRERLEIFVKEHRFSILPPYLPDPSNINGSVMSVFDLYRGFIARKLEHNRLSCVCGYSVDSEKFHASLQSAVDRVVWCQLPSVLYGEKYRCFSSEHHFIKAVIPALIIDAIREREFEILDRLLAFFKDRSKRPDFVGILRDVDCGMPIAYFAAELEHSDAIRAFDILKKHGVPARGVIEYIYPVWKGVSPKVSLLVNVALETEDIVPFGFIQHLAAEESLSSNEDLRNRAIITAFRRMGGDVGCVNPLPMSNLEEFINSVLNRSLRGSLYSPPPYWSVMIEWCVRYPHKITGYFIPAHNSAFERAVVLIAIVLSTCARFLWAATRSPRAICVNIVLGYSRVMLDAICACIGSRMHNALSSAIELAFHEIAHFDCSALFHRLFRNYHVNLAGVNTCYIRTYSILGIPAYRDSTSLDYVIHGSHRKCPPKHIAKVRARIASCFKNPGQLWNVASAPLRRIVYQLMLIRHHEDCSILCIMPMELMTEIFISLCYVSRMIHIDNQHFPFSIVL